MQAARETDDMTYLVVLLGGEAGLRCGEMMALEWKDVDLAKDRLCVAQSEWKGHVGSQGWAGTIRAAHVSARIPGIIAAKVVRVARRRTPPPPGLWSPRQSAPADHPGHSSLICSAVDTLPPASPKNPLS